MHGIRTPRRQREEDWEFDQLEQDTIKLKELENLSLKCRCARIVGLTGEKTRLLLPWQE